MSRLNLLLASVSPRRRELMRLLNLPFEVCSTDIDETPRPGESAPGMVERLSRAKALVARTQQPNKTIIACDTTVELDGAILGKPRDEEEARVMLRALRGRAHSVYGGIAIASPTPFTLSPGRDEGIECLVVHTRVWMRNYLDVEIEAYVATGDPLDKAAAYAVQHPAFRPVARVEGCFANVMGLALCHLYTALVQRQSLPEPCLFCQHHPGQDCTVAQLVAEGALAGA